jgi:amino-acid N-acetyltransferase
MVYKIEKARIHDATQIHKLINYFADKGEMLPRPLSEIYENIRDYFVVRQGEQVIACSALHISWVDLAEIKSLAVTENHQKQGIGDQLAEYCLKEADNLGIATVFCLTYIPEFFKKCGFSQVDKSELPHKVWGECYRCPKFPSCDEVALIYHLEAGA